MGNIKRIFLASPNDVVAERKIVTKVIDEINAVLPRDFDCRYEVIKWETHVDSRIGSRPQVVINKQVGIKNIDIFIGILWSRFGSPTGGKRKSGRKYLSGTEEEFDIAFQSWKEKGSPELMFFRKTKNPPYNTDPKQFQKVKRFFNKFKAKEVYQGLYSEFNTRPKFEKLVRSAILRDVFKRYSEHQSSPVKVNDGSRFPDGFEKIFTAQTNHIRNEEKETSISSTGELKLIAHSGFSFIAPLSQRYRYDIEEKLKTGKFKFKIILTNPWSDSGFYFAIDEQDKEALQKSCDYNENGIKSFSKIIDVLEGTRWYNDKFANSITGYKELRKKYGDKIELKLVRYDVPASILIADNECFFEPYLPIKYILRHQRSMITFEMKVSKKSSLYEYSSDYFDFLWSISDDFDIYSKNEILYKKILKEKESFLKEG